MTIWKILWTQYLQDTKENTWKHMEDIMDVIFTGHKGKHLETYGRYYGRNIYSTQRKTPGYGSEISHISENEKKLTD